MVRLKISIQKAPFHIADEQQMLQAANPHVGAIVSFTGVVRNNLHNNLKELFIEHYPGMTESALRKMAQRAIARWNLDGCTVIHRVGSLLPGEDIVLVITASSHRQEAFNAAEFMMDYLKSKAPFWKKEIALDGAEWVASQTHDEVALDRWNELG